MRGFDFEGGAAEPTAQLLPAAEARATYDEIVSRVKDPALLEFAGHNTVRSSVFPVPAHGTQHVRLIYEHVLEADGDRVDYVLPTRELTVTGSGVVWPAAGDTLSRIAAASDHRLVYVDVPPR